MLFSNIPMKFNAIDKMKTFICLIKPFETEFKLLLKFSDCYVIEHIIDIYLSVQFGRSSA